MRYDGAPFNTHSSLLQPVIYDGLPCMLKIAIADEERRGNLLMNWWQGNSVPKVLKYDDHAILMERSMGKDSLAEMAKNGRDDEASTIICGVVQKLHAAKPPYPDGLVPLDTWFRDLEPAAAKYGRVFAQCSSVANQLLNDQRDITVLHGDIHHNNILDFGNNGWLAIDPKGLIGERGFDYANIFCNPDAGTATKPGRLAEQVRIISKITEIEPRRLLQWIIALAGLSAAWEINDNGNANSAFQVAELALTQLGQ